MVPRPTSYFAAICGGLSLLLGLAVVIGWHTHTTRLIQILPSFVPMQYNTALGFLLSGLGLVLVSFEKNEKRIIWGVMVALIGSLTLIEYLFDVNLKIDQLLMEHYIEVKTSHLGRMAPNTALCFTLTGLALIIQNIKSHIPRRQNMVGILGVLILSLGIVAFTGYFLKLETAYGWAHLTRMAIHTSAGFVILGIGLVGMSWGRDTIEYLKGPHWAGSVLSISIFSISLLLWQAFTSAGQIHLGREILAFGGGAAVATFLLIFLFQNLMARARELERKNAELERFAYTVSHDLKSPLITIEGFSGFLREDLEANNFEKTKEDLDRIHEAVKKMRNLLSGLLELSRIGRVVNISEWIPLSDLIQEAVTLLQGRVKEKSIKVQVEEGLPEVYGDRPRLFEAFLNLIDNACKFTGSQPHPNIRIGMDSRVSGPVFYVEDNGMGLKKEYSEQIFELFYKLDAGSDGNGIGLALVKQIIELHDGKIWVESEGPGKGTRFNFTFGQLRELKGG